MRFFKHSVAVVAVFLCSHSTSAALLTYDGEIDSCIPAFVCGLFGVDIGGGVGTILSVPEGPANLQLGDVDGWDSTTNTPISLGVGLVVEGLGTAVSLVTASSLVTDATNNLVSGGVELTFTQTQGGPGTDIIRTIVTTIGADGLFNSITRNGPLIDPIVLTTLGSGSWTVIPPTPVPLPATAWLFGAGLLGLVGVARRRRIDKVA